jgi:hypothetical protein
LQVIKISVGSKDQLEIHFQGRCFEFEEKGFKDAKFEGKSFRCFARVVGFRRRLTFFTLSSSYFCFYDLPNKKNLQTKNFVQKYAELLSTSNSVFGKALRSFFFLSLHKSFGQI